MELSNAKISILVNDDRTTIDVKDSDAAITFLKIELTPEQLSQCLSRLVNVKCESAIVCDLDKVGKKHTNKKLEFKMPSESMYKDVDTATKLAKENCPDGWEPDLYFGSQESFFYKDGELWAECTIRKWI